MKYTSKLDKKTDWLTDRLTDICISRAAFAVEKGMKRVNKFNSASVDNDADNVLSLHEPSMNSSNNPACKVIFANNYANSKQV